MQQTTHKKPAGYDEEWRAEADEEEAPAEVQRAAALSTLATTAMGLVNESIRDRNATTFSSEISRSYKLYNAVSIDPNDDLLADFEGTRTAVKTGSKVVQNIIRQLTNDGASQLGDMLYPTDQENYGLLPIFPARPPLAIKSEQVVMPDGQPMVDGEGNPVTHQMAWTARKVQLEHKVGRMHEKIKNNLERVRFGKLGRKLINDGARTGTAILKGPFVDDSRPKKWRAKDNKWSMEQDDGTYASFSTVSVLDFLPDMSADSKDNMAYASIREWNLPRQLRKLRASGNYNESEIDALLTAPPRKSYTAESGDLERNSIMDTALVEKLYAQRYEVFETWAEFDVEVLRAAGVKALPAADDSGAPVTILACVIHCEGRCLKAYLNPLESGELPFSIWCWDEDPTSIFGKSIPVLAENCQLIYNAVWRMILDHGGLSAVPMVGMLKGKVTPAAGDKNDYSLRGGKVWLIDNDIFNVPDASNHKPFEIYEIPVHLDQFFAIMEKAEEDAYKLTGVTRIEKAQQGVDNAPLTLGATQIYANNASVSRRRQVRDFDDDITKDALTRLYNWLMQFEPEDSDFKGPMEIEPRGSSVLMQREVNTQNLMQLYTLTGNGAADGAKPVEMLREIQSGMQFPDGRFIETRDETESRIASEAENPPIPPEIAIQQEELALERERVEADAEIRYMTYEVLKAEKMARVELDTLNAERLHYREMLKLETISEIEANKHFTALQQRQEEVSGKLQVQLEGIQSGRDIAAGSMLQKDKAMSQSAQAQLITAAAKEREALTKERELDSKVAGTIKQGI